MDWSDNDKIADWRKSLMGVWSSQFGKMLYFVLIMPMQTVYMSRVCSDFFKYSYSKHVCFWAAFSNTNNNIYMHNVAKCKFLCI